MSQVLIVSNRLPISVKKENGVLVYVPSLGGVSTGLSSYVNDRSNVWVGWPGIASEELTERDKEAIATELGKHNCFPVFLSKKQIADYYNGYCNTVLWPMFHDLPARRYSKAHLNAWWTAYRKVNDLFAETVINLANPKAQIWIHDYHLLLLPNTLRKKNSEATIGFFSHVPFPKQKTLTRLPEAKRLVNGILGANVVGFHTNSYVKKFLKYVSISGIGKVSENRVYLASRQVKVQAFPMGIDFEKYAAARKSRGVKLAVKRYKKKYARQKIIASVDRLDPTKGLIERLSAYKEFLKRNPKYIGRVVFAMVAAPSRTEVSPYMKLSLKLNELAAEINEAYGNDKWTPVDLMNISQPFEEVAALFQIADIAFITPLRDGMNLTAKEFVATNKNHGVLILSETAGAAEELNDALIVNPKQIDSLIEALEKAIRMHRREYRGRLKRMKKILSTNTVQFWAKSFVTAINQPIVIKQTKTLNKQILNQLVTDYRQAKKRLILLDYDGTLVPFNKNYKKALPPKSLISLLNKLSQDKSNEIVLISGRSSLDLENWFGGLKINLVSEHGASIKKASNTRWHSIEKANSNWQRLLLPVLEKYKLLTPGADIEVKAHSLVWHYRAATPYQGQKYTVVIKSALKPILKDYGLELMQGSKSLEIKNPLISKVNAAEQWLDQGFPFVVFIGDDATDEPLFVGLKANQYGIKVGPGRTAAAYRAPSSKEVLSLLKMIASI
ncbi:MAG TPA: bifunctional alpha,alpha-trehalose-phosphate synthase (UDP-forming)/trehalose-phosphatase [Candidatus Saccharimonadales bacterium]